MKRLLVAGLWLYHALALAAGLDIRLPTTGEGGSRDHYQRALLRLILDESGYDYRIRVVPLRFSQARVIHELERGDLINLYWMGTSPALERRLIPIRHPLYGGLLGYRLLIVRDDRQPEFDQVRRLEDLRRFVGGQGIGWADVGILENAGLPQRQRPYTDLFALVEAGHVDYFSRGITEIFQEIAEKRAIFPHLTIERRLVIHYPFAMFFFVSPRHPEIASALRKGFSAAYRDGRFERFFRTRAAIVEALRKGRLRERRVIEIPNPFLTPETRSLTAIHGYQESNSDGP